MSCHRCGATNDPSARFCRQCGAELARPLGAGETAPKRYCAKCGAVLKDGIAFCGKCGAAVDRGPGSDGTTANAATSVVGVVNESAAKRPPATTEALTTSTPKASSPPPPPPPPRTSAPTPSVAPSQAPAVPRADLGRIEPAASASLPMKTANAQAAGKGLALYGGVAAALLVVVLAIYAVRSGDAGAPADTAAPNPVPPAAAEVTAPTVAAPVLAVDGADRNAASAVQPANGAEVSPPATQVEGQESAAGAGQPSAAPTQRSDVAKPAATPRSAVKRDAIEPNERVPEPLKPPASPPPQPSTQVAVPAPSELPAPTQRPSNWREALAKEVEDCGTKNIFERVVCIERAKWKHCEPDRWGKVPECPGAAKN